MPFHPHSQVSSFSQERVHAQSLPVANVEVTDPEVYGEYAKIAKDAIESHGSRFVARGGRHIPCEGRDRAPTLWLSSRLSKRLKCYNSEIYREALAFSAKSSVRDVVLIEGVE